MAAKQGDTVSVLFTGKLNDNTVFDSSNGEPFKFQLGSGMVIPGFEDAVIGMNIGQEKTVIVPSELAYGPHIDDLVTTVNRDLFPPEIAPEKGKQVRVANQAGQTFIVTITEINDGHVTLDANHPLAGKDLTFNITLLEIIPPLESIDGA
ncbi:MAG TPA: peptidylprolyl isomerase [Chitinispirillaceae bacterium]|nr:peptidylprolyl isomerase [Chitinispirillaceae bacterium]